MSFSWIRKVVLAAALAVMPLHGIAAALTVLNCHGDAQAHGMHDPSGHDHGDTSHDHGISGGEDQGGAANPYHLCCNLTASAPSSITFSLALPDFPIQSFVPDTPHDLFVPELPQRPPLA